MFAATRKVAVASSVAAAGLLSGCISDPAAPVTSKDSTPALASSSDKGTRDTAASESRAKGAREASEAIRAGKLKLKEYPPLPSPANHVAYVRLLRERCGVQYEVPALVPGVSDADFTREVQGWNEVMQAEIKRKFGADIFERLQEEASKRWQDQLKPKGVP
jgi:hypothetical protein